jgi:ubiquinone/menaquinone biosynthesis C-methylase UbiE
VASLKTTSSDWESMARTDPLWAVCTELGPQDGSYDELERFWESGRKDVDAAIKHVEACGLDIDRDGEALDFGCGPGRVSQPLAEVFARCVGVDISPTMLELARGFNANLDRLSFTLNERADLSIFADDRFAFAYSTRVLQHIPRRYALAYLGELVRILSRDRGVLVFHAHEIEGGAVFSGCRLCSACVSERLVSASDSRERMPASTTARALRSHRACTCFRFQKKYFVPSSRHRVAGFSTSYRWDSIRCAFVPRYSQSLIDGTVDCSQWNTLL